MQKIICIVGPTGVGKTELAFQLAQKFNGELVSADSVQVYKGLDIISGKDIPQNYSFTALDELSSKSQQLGFYSSTTQPPIYLVDVVGPQFSFTVYHFVDAAEKVIEFISNKNRVPIIVGGTGLYISSLLNEMSTYSIQPDTKFRQKLQQLSVDELQKMLPREKIQEMNNSDKNNPRRLIRLIELSKTQTEKIISESEKYNALVIGLTCSRELLKQRIDERVEKRIEEGALQECKTLFKTYKNLSSQVKNANGYKPIFSFLNNEISWEECVERWKIAEYRHAKNQMTWFQKYGNVIWFDGANKKYKSDIENNLKKFLA